MKRLFFLFCLLMLFVRPSAAQTYEQLCERAAIAIERDSLDVAEQAIRAALRLDPANGRNALLFANLGTVQRLRGQLPEALESYTYALNMAPRNVPILLDRAAILLELGEADKARIDYSLALDIQPDKSCRTISPPVPTTTICSVSNPQTSTAAWAWPCSARRKES